MVGSNAKEAQRASRQIRNVTSTMIVMITRMKALMYVVHRVHSKPTAVDGKKRSRITLIGQDSMDVQRRVELAGMQQEILQV